MKISIITVNFNDKTGLEKTLQSSIRLTLPAGVEKEIVVIDGGSKDGSVDVLKKYLSDITYWVSEKDRGIFHAMNKGIAAASGDYCIFMNSGDSFASEDVLEKIFANPYPENAASLQGAERSRFSNRSVFITFMDSASGVEMSGKYENGPISSPSGTLRPISTAR